MSCTQVGFGLVMGSLKIWANRFKMAMCEELHCKEFLTPLDYYQDYKDYKKLG
jgi:hypothetical protein